MAISMADHGVQGVGDFGELLEEMMQKAEEVKQTNSVEPALSKSDFADLVEKLESTFYRHAKTLDLRKPGHAIIEAAFRDRFNNLLAATNINSPDFVRIWNLLDIISFLSDNEQCDAALLFWLVEELLDSQTIAGCRRTFDYLESRRERITAKNFSQKNLVILRTCNELLRRLSRADDTAFCGRVFIFMFQSFPLGDRSSVNLRGEYHTENVTTYDALPKEPTPIPESEKMDVDKESAASTVPKVVTNGEKSELVSTSTSKPDKSLSADALYPIFWSLQESFNQPKKLFDQSTFTGFKAGLEATMAMFDSINETAVRPAQPVEEGKRGVKRKRSQGEDDLANTFNPRYLTSKDLFELELSDLPFRRSILIQVLIVLDFLISFSVTAKEKLAKSLPEIQNKSVVYADQSLSEEDTQWVLDQKTRAAKYLTDAHEGAFFFRMVQTVLSRDKNWVRWKIENCQPISRPSLSPEDYLSARAAAKKSTTNKRLRPNPLGSLDLKFLIETDNRGGLERLKNPSRYQLPSVESFRSKIELDDMDIDMAKDEEEKNTAIDAKTSKSWRTLRLASTTKLVAFDKIEKSDKIDVVFQDDSKGEDVGDESIDSSEDVTFPKDRRSIVISGPSGVGKGTLVSMLLEKHAAVFGKTASHTTRPPRTGEVHGTHYQFVTKEEYDVLRDGDEFIEINNYNGNDYGTSRKIVDGIIAKGKVPVMEMDYHGIQQCKDIGFAARYIFLAPPSNDELEQRLRRRGSDDEDKIKGRLDIAKKEIEHSKVLGFHDKIFVNDDLEATYSALEKYIFGEHTAEDIAEDVVEDAAEREESPLSELGDGVVEALATSTSADLPTEMET